jgi:hypothetical protein
MQRDEKRRKVVRVTEDCFATVVREFLASPKFAGYARPRKTCGGAISISQRARIAWGRCVDEWSPPWCRATSTA